MSTEKTWGYRIFKYQKTEEVGLHGVVYNSKKEISGFTTKPIVGPHKNLEILLNDIKLMIIDATLHKEDIVNYEEAERKARENKDQEE